MLKNKCIDFVPIFRTRVKDAEANEVAAVAEALFREFGIRTDVDVLRDIKTNKKYSYYDCGISCPSLGFDTPVIRIKFKNRIRNVRSYLTKQHIIGLREVYISLIHDYGYTDGIMTHNRYIAEVFRKYGNPITKETVYKIDESWPFERDCWTVRLSTDARARGYRCRNTYLYEPKNHYIFGPHLGDVIDEMKTSLQDMIFDLNLADEAESEE